MLSEILVIHMVRFPLHYFPYHHQLKIAADLGCYIQGKYIYKYNTWLISVFTTWGGNPQK